MNHDLVELERKALELKISGRIDEAAKLFSMIVEKQPNWEHGTAFLDLAQCYEDLGQLDLAEKYYRAALSYEPNNISFLGGLASYLYLHGKPEDAFNAYLELLVINKRNRYEEGIKRSLTALKALGEKLGWSEADVAGKVEKRLD